MPASVTARQPKNIILQIEVPIESGNMLNLEDGLQRALNEAGLLGTQELLKLFEPPKEARKGSFIMHITCRLCPKKPLNIQLTDIKNLINKLVMHDERPDPSFLRAFYNKSYETSKPFR